MLTITQAYELANQYLQDCTANSDMEFVIIRDYTIEFKYGWLFCYQSRKYVETKNERYLLVGNAPVLVDKFNSTITDTGTGMGQEFYIEKYCKYRHDLALYKEMIWERRY